MKIMVGTLYSGEGDYHKCCEAISSQTQQNDHIVIANKQEADAHFELYNTFKQTGYDYLIKVDADIVLADVNVIRDLVSLTRDRRVDKATYSVHDFYTQTIMHAIHCYAKHVKWDMKNIIRGNLKPDRYDSAKKIINTKEIRGKHCYYSNEKQSFHFGYHRYLKGQYDRIKQSLQHYKNNDNSMLRMVCIGALCAAHSPFEYIGYDNHFDDCYVNNEYNKLLRNDIINRLGGILR